MSPLLLTLLIVLILPLFLATWRASLTGLALQGILMGWLAYRLHPHWSAALALTELDLVGLRAVAVPLFLGRVLARHRAASRNDVIPPNMLAWTAALTLVLMAFRFADAASPNDAEAHMVVAVSISGVLLGLLILATQSGAFSQIVGVLRIENAIALFEIGTSAEEESLPIRFGQFLVLALTLAIFAVYLGRMGGTGVVATSDEGAGAGGDELVPGDEEEAP